MSEIFSWTEGQLHIYTGSHTASGNPVAYVENVNLSTQIAWQSRPAVDGTYRSRITNERADFSFQVGYLLGAALPQLLEARTGLHVKFTHSNGLGSAGYIAYSAVLTDGSLNGSQGGVYNQSFNGYCHTWSAF
jgi:hypothetical protein